MILVKIKDFLLRSKMFLGGLISRRFFSLGAGLLVTVVAHFMGLGVFSFFLGLLVFFVSFSVKWSFFILFFFIVAKHQLRILELFPDIFLTIVIPALLFFTVITELLYSKRNPAPSTGDFLLVLFLLFSIPSTVMYSYVFGFSKFQVLDFFVFALVFGFYLLGRLLTSELMVRAAWINYFIALMVSLHGIIQYFFLQGYYPWAETFGEAALRSYGVMGNPNAFSGYLLMSFFISLILVRKKLDFVMLLPLLGGIALSQSRGALIALLFAFLFYFFVWAKKHKIKYLATSFLVFILIGLSQALPRFTNLGSSDYFFNSMVSGRLWAIKNVLYINSQSYFSRVFGNGWGSYGGEHAYGGLSGVYSRGVQGGTIGVPNTDNQWLQLYAQQGLLGVVFLFCFLVNTFLSNINRTRLSYGVLAGMVLMFFIDLIQFYQAGSLFFLLLGVLNSRDVELPR